MTWLNTQQKASGVWGVCVLEPEHKSLYSHGPDVEKSLDHHGDLLPRCTWAPVRPTPSSPALPRTPGAAGAAAGARRRPAAPGGGAARRPWLGERSGRALGTGSVSCPHSWSQFLPEAKRGDRQNQWIHPDAQRRHDSSQFLRETSDLSSAPDRNRLLAMSDSSGGGRVAVPVYPVHQWIITD